MKGWREETIYNDGDRFFSDLCDAISSARESVNLETYIFDHDSLGRRVIELLCKAARRGVQVRLLLDGFGCSSWSYEDLGELSTAGVETRFFHPLPWQNFHYPFWHSLSIRRILLGIWKLNRRNHRKTCVIDGEIAFLGGMNISARHLVTASGKRAWRDTSVRVQGDALVLLMKAFDNTWAHTRGASFKLGKRRKRELSALQSFLRLNVTHQQRKMAYEDLVRRILEARERVWITNPYFVPELALVRALRYAAWAGVDVQLLLPKRNDVWGLKWAIQAFYFILLTAGVRIFEYAPSILHAKIVLIDDWAMVGSSNLNHRSLFQDLEVDVVLSWKESNRSLEKQFLRDVSFSKETRARHWARRSWGGRLLERLALLFRRWL